MLTRTPARGEATKRLARSFLLRGVSCAKPGPQIALQMSSAKVDFPAQLQPEMPSTSGNMIAVDAATRNEWIDSETGNTVQSWQIMNAKHVACRLCVQCVSICAKVPATPNVRPTEIDQLLLAAGYSMKTEWLLSTMRLSPESRAIFKADLISTLNLSLFSSTMNFSEFFLSSVLTN